MWITSMYNTSKTTLELRQIVDNSVNLWDFDYPSYYTGLDKKGFEQKVIDHYYFRQIGFETVGRFLHCFRTRVREIMPYYIELYKTAEIMANLDDPFGNVDVTETFEQSTERDSTDNLTGGSDNKTTNKTTNNGSATDELTKTDKKTTTEDKTQRFSDTPQNSIDNVNNYMTNATVEDNSYIDNINTTGKQTSTNALTSDSTITNTLTTTQSNNGNMSETVKHTITRKGNQGVNTYAHDMREFRETILNIDMMIINDLKDLFLQVY